MELEYLEHILRESPRTSDQSSYGDLSGESSFSRVVEIEMEMKVPKSESEQLRLSWLRSQVIGAAAEFDSPFGKRKLTYADHTASGRSLLYIENFIINNVLPFYGNTI